MPTEIRKRTIWMDLSVGFLAFLAKLFSGATLRWVDCQPDSCQRVYFANHTTHLDALVLWTSLPRSLRELTMPVAASDYWERGPVRRFLAKALNVLLISRKDVRKGNSPIVKMLDTIGETYSLIIFPEGTRSDGEIQEFKSGLFHIGKRRPDLELVPVYIDNMNKVMPKGEVIPLPMLSCITIGPPIWLEVGETKDEFLTRARQAVINLRDV